MDEGGGRCSRSSLLIPRVDNVMTSTTSSNYLQPLKHLITSTGLPASVPPSSSRHGKNHHTATSTDRGRARAVSTGMAQGCCGCQSVPICTRSKSRSWVWYWDKLKRIEKQTARESAQSVQAYIPEVLEKRVSKSRTGYESARTRTPGGRIETKSKDTYNIVTIIIIDISSIDIVNNRIDIDIRVETPPSQTSSKLERQETSVPIPILGAECQDDSSGGAVCKRRRARADGKAERGAAGLSGSLSVGRLVLCPVPREQGE
jgi:hypothetical protein